MGVPRRFLPSISALRALEALDRLGSATAAAKELSLTQSAISRQLKTLEEQLGVQLIFRGSRFGGLTPEGQSALVWARRIVGDARQLKDEMRNTRHGLSGRVRIAAIPTALTWASRLVTGFAARHPNVSKVSEATELLKAQDPDLIADGDIQFDAAFVPEIASRKATGSPLEGRANIMVFPNLEAGNIGYKIAQRIGGATAIGPILQGLAKPANDLSRGCTTEDVFDMIAVTTLQAQTRVAQQE